MTCSSECGSGGELVRQEAKEETKRDFKPIFSPVIEAAPETRRPLKPLAADIGEPEKNVAACDGVEQSSR
jgi:hypothetical protein